MNLGKDVVAEFKGGKLVVSIPGKLDLSLNVGGVAIPELEKIEAKIQSGEIDIIKGTDLDKAAFLTVIAAIKVELNK